MLSDGSFSLVSLDVFLNQSNCKGANAASCRVFLDGSSKCGRISFKVMAVQFNCDLIAQSIFSLYIMAIGFVSFVVNVLNTYRKKTTFMCLLLLVPLFVALPAHSVFRGFVCGIPWTWGESKAQCMVASLFNSLFYFAFMALAIIRFFRQTFVLFVMHNIVGVFNLAFIIWDGVNLFTLGNVEDGSWNIGFYSGVLARGVILIFSLLTSKIAVRNAASPLVPPPAQPPFDENDDDIPSIIPF